MKAPLPPVPYVPPLWVRTSTDGSGAFAGDTARPEPAVAPTFTPPPAGPPEPLMFELAPKVAEQVLLPPPPIPEAFATLRSEDGRAALTNEGLELNSESFAWRELEGVDAQPVRWLLGVLLGVFIFLGFLLAYLQFWLSSPVAALGIGLGLALLAWGLRGTNRWRVHRPGRETRYFSFSGPARGWQQLASEANRRIGQRHHETGTATAYWLQQATLLVPDAPNPEPAEASSHPSV